MVIFTENFLMRNGIQVNNPEEIPEIDYSKKYSMVDYNKIKQNIADIKEFNEVGLGGGHPNKGLKQFLENYYLKCFYIKLNLKWCGS